MRVFLIRHVEAQPKDEVERDEDRSITPRGETKLRKGARGLRRLDLFPDRILTSPLKRAVATAHIIADELGFTGEVEAVDELSPDSDPAELKEVLADMHEEQILLVGHQPFLGELAGALIGSGDAQIGVKKGGLIRVDVENWGNDPPGKLRWLFTVKQLSWMRKKKKKKADGSD